MKINFRNSLLSATFLVLAIVIGSTITAQTNCDISVNATPPLCPGGIYTFSVDEIENGSYTWTKDGEEVGQNLPELTLTVDAASLISVTVKDTITSENCSDDLQVSVHEDFTIEFTQWQLTCSNGNEDNGNNAKVQAFAIGAQEPEEYIYEWNVEPIQIAPGTPSLAIGLKAHLKYSIEVTDINGCAKKDTVYTESYPNPEIELYADPDTAYIQNPYITFSFDNLSSDSIEVSNHFWDFGDESETTDLDSPTHAYQEEGAFTTTLTVFNGYGCDTNYIIEVQIKPVNLFIPNVFTPNGDGINDTFIITENQNTSGGDDGDGLKSASAFEYESYDPLELYYERSELNVFNRWGRIVYQSGNYQNDWDGSNLPDGVYFYVLRCYGAKSDDTFKGSVSIYGSGR